MKCIRTWNKTDVCLKFGQDERDWHGNLGTSLQWDLPWRLSSLLTAKRRGQNAWMLACDMLKKGKSCLESGKHAPMKPIQKILGGIRSPADSVFKLRGNGKWCHALVTHPSSGTVIQKPEAIGLLPLVSGSRRVTDSDVPRGHVVYLSGWWMQVWIRVADAEMEPLEEGEETRYCRFMPTHGPSVVRSSESRLSLASTLWQGRSHWFLGLGWMATCSSLATCSQFAAGALGGLVPFWIYKVIVVLWRICYWATFHKLDFYLLLRHAMIIIFPHVCV